MITKNSIIFFSILVLFIPAANAAFSGSYDMLNQDNISWNGTFANSKSGWMLDWADLNNDGNADAIVSAFLNNSVIGAVYILYGPQDQVTDVSIQSKANVTLSGEAGFNSFFGICLGSGDINGDGYDDLIIGATSYPGGSGPGRLYIIYGRNGIIPSGDIGTVKNASINGSGSDPYLGMECDTADVNGDSYDDILASAYVSGGGKTYLVYGQSTPFPSDSLITNVYNESWSGAAASDRAYFVRRAGDVNNDGYEDVLIGSIFNSGGNNGTVSLIYGQSASFNRQNYTIPSGTNATFTGEANSNLGMSVSSAGDFNNDGYDDFTMSAYNYNSGAGRIYFFYGGPGLPWNGAYPAISANATFTGINAGDYAGATSQFNTLFLGGALSYGDFNTDGYSDVLVGVKLADIGGRSDNGQVVLYYGRPALLSGNYLLNMTDANATFYGESNTNYLCTLPTGMAEGVTKESILMGAENFNSAEGKTYIMLGDPPQPPPPPPYSLVPEFSITTLLLTILIAGGLIFAIRRHH